ncbi:tetratricopeptide repeat protein [Photobacterium rosenbergii]|uniref:tetratricopeptide repeat protein n=1 Tax=Photobacterium rosenbergii TaxID=294936 RepID=UPI001C99023A|nr:hypothetical protein [Photobacterium rosenbergii]MBY5947322.1 hypothetical protein [Photobacterium rosenbergii]
MKIDVTPTATLTLQEAFQLGVTRYKEGNKKQARYIFESLLARAPEAIDVLQVLAVLDVEDKKYLEAEKKLRLALSHCNDTAITLDLAHCLKLQGKNSEAIQWVDEILNLHPLHSGALELRSAISQAMGQRSDSKKAGNIANTVQAAKSGHIQSEIQKTLETAGQLMASNNYALAEQLLKPLTLVDKTNIAVLSTLAKVCSSQDKHTEASHYYQQILDTESSAEFAILELARSCIKAKTYDIGIKACQTFNKHNPTMSLSVHIHWIELLYGKKLYDKAIDIINRIKVKNANHPDVLWVDAVVNFYYLKDVKSYTVKDMTSSEKKILKAINGNKSNINRLNELNACLYLLNIFMGRFNEAENMLHTVHGDKSSILWNISPIKRASHNWGEYYQYYEEGIPANARMTFSLDNKKWDPRTSDNEDVLIVREQGVGDELFFYHNLDYVIKRSNKVYLACDRRLVPILEIAYPEVECIPLIPNTEFIHNRDKLDILNKVDSWIPAGSIEQHIYREYDAHWIRESYVKTPPEQQSYWENKVKQYAQPDQLKIGLSWRSGLKTNVRNLHYLSLDEVAHFMKQFPNATFYNLQYGECAKEIKKLKKLTGMDIVNFDDLDLKDDFLSTAAVMNSLDTVFTVGSAVYRLAVATGVQSYIFFARKSDDDFSQPITFFGEDKDKKHENLFAYPPLIENKYPLVESIASKIKKDFNI